MRDPTGDIIQYVYDSLNGKLSYQDEDYPVYLVAPIKDTFEYVLIENLSFTDASTSGTNDYECLLQININDKGVNTVSFKRINEISNQIFTILIKRAWSVPGWSVTAGPLISNASIQKFNTNIEILITKAIVITFNLQENG